MSFAMRSLRRFIDLTAKNPAVLLIYLVSAFLVYGWFLGNPFVMDDEIQVVDNVHIQTLDDVLSFFTSSSMGSGGRESMGGIYYKPLMTTFYAVVWDLFGATPAAFRIPLLALHALSAFFVFLISLRFLPRAWSFVAGAIFLLHPANAEVVLYIADAQDVFYMVFGLGALVAVQRLHLGWPLAVVTFLLLWGSVLSKETGFLFLGIVTLWAFLIDRAKFRMVFAVAALVGAGYLGLRFAIGLVHVTNDQLVFSSAGFGQRLSMFPLVLGHFLEIYFVPIRLSLTTDFVLEQLTFEQFWGPLAICVAAIASLGVFIHREWNTSNRNIVLFLGGVLLLWLALHTHLLVPLDGVYADRWLYLATWAITSLLLIFLRDRSLMFPRLSKALPLLALITLIGFAVRATIRAQDWRQPLHLYAREVALHPWDAVMNNNVGVELFRAGQVTEAGEYFRKATEMNPRWNVAWSNLGAVAERFGETDKALNAYESSMARGSYWLAYENYAALLWRTGQWDRCREFLPKALAVFPKNQTLRAIEAQLRTGSDPER